jgi:hypothetical protein
VIIQTEQLLALGVAEDRIYIDRGLLSGTTRRNRVGLDQALAAVWDGTVFTVTKFDRSGGRSWPCIRSAVWARSTTSPARPCCWPPMPPHG